MADDPLMVLPASAVRHAQERQTAEQRERDRFARIAKLATRPGAVQALTQMWVTCARCRRPVERMAWTGIPGQQGQDFTVFCHGAQETTRVAIGADVVALTGGVAFRESIDG